MSDKQDIPKCWLCEGTGLDGWSGEECAHCNGTGEHPAYKAMRERAEQADASRDQLGKALDYLVHFNTEDALTNAKATLLDCRVPHHSIQGWRPEVEDEE